jgi:hypothetical protein
VKKTVTFFEVVDENDQPFAAEDWQVNLRQLRDRQNDHGVVDLRHEIGGVRHYAQVYTHQGECSLVIARERDEPPSTLDESTGQIIDETTQASRPWVEICVLSFIAGTNVFGFVLGGMASPRAGVVSQWFNKDGETFDELVEVRPHTADALVGMLQDGSSEARMVSVRLDAAQIYGDGVNGAGLFSATQDIGRQLNAGPEVDVEVILRIRGRADSASEGTRRWIADRARELIGMNIRGGQAEIIEYTDNEQTDRELVDLVKHKMATKEEVSVMDDDGRQVRIPSAINAISRAADRLGIGQ